jgi:hypothetical protein
MMVDILYDECMTLVKQKELNYFDIKNDRNDDKECALHKRTFITASITKPTHGLTGLL